MARYAARYWFMGCGQRFGWMVRDLEGTWVENFWQGNLGKRYVDRCLWKGKNLKIFVFHVNAHQRVTSAEEDFNNHLERMSHLWLSVSLLPKPPPSSPNGLMNKVAVVARTEVIHGLSHMYLHSPRLTWLWSLLSTKSISSRNQHWVFDSVHEQPATWW